MSAGLAISLDAMGGDNAPEMVVRGADIARRRFPQAKFLFFGDEAKVRPLLESLPDLKKVSTLRHTVSVVTMEDKPSQALRSGRGSSMRLAIDAVHNGEADAVVSAGNTGALMAMAKFVLKTMPGIDRPAWRWARPRTVWAAACDANLRCQRAAPSSSSGSAGRASPSRPRGDGSPASSGCGLEIGRAHV